MFGPFDTLTAAREWCQRCAGSAAIVAVFDSAGVDPVLVVEAPNAETVAAIVGE